MSKPKRRGRKHRTPDELKALYAARGKEGYCVPPEKGKFRQGDGRRRGGPRKPKEEASLPPQKSLDAMIEEIATEPVTLRDRVTGRPTRTRAIQAVLMQERAAALAGDEKARASFLTRSEKALKAQEADRGAIVKKIAQFILDTHAGRHWKLTDVNRDAMIDFAWDMGDEVLIGQLVMALQVHDMAEPGAYERYAERMKAWRAASKGIETTAPPDAPAPTSPPPPPPAAVTPAPKGADKPAPPVSEPKSMTCPDKDCAALDAFRAPRGAPPKGDPFTPGISWSVDGKRFKK